MKRISILSLLWLLMCIPAMRAQSSPTISLVDETLTYDVIYKWGFINKVAGYATMSLRNDGDCYKASVFAETRRGPTVYICCATRSTPL